MTRLRLRLMVQEFDLKGPEVVIGRSPTCHLTIEDPMVSRMHAKIRVEENRAFLSDLGSRNGVRVNGRKIAHEIELVDSDRIRIGTREMVFTVQKHEERSSRTTGYLRMCDKCGIPFPDESLRCPHCGHEVVREEETVSGMFRSPEQGWTMDLFFEVIERGLSKGRFDDSLRMLEKLRIEIDGRTKDGYRIGGRDMEKLTDLVVQICNHFGHEDSLSWLFLVCRAQSTFPVTSIMRRIERLDVHSHPNLRPSIDAFRNWLSVEATPSLVVNQEICEPVRPSEPSRYDVS